MQTDVLLERMATVLKKEKYFIDVSINDEEVNYFTVMKNGNGTYQKVRSLVIYIKHDFGKIKRGRKLTIYEPDVIAEIKRLNRGQKISKRMNENITYTDAVKILNNVTGGVINLTSHASIN